MKNVSVKAITKKKSKRSESEAAGSFFLFFEENLMKDLCKINRKVRKSMTFISLDIRFIIYIIAHIRENYMYYYTYLYLYISYNYIIYFINNIYCVFLKVQIKTVLYTLMSSENFEKNEVCHCNMSSNIKSFSLFKAYPQEGKHRSTKADKGLILNLA